MCGLFPYFSHRGPILAPRPLTPKWTSLDLSWVMARGICGTLSPSVHRPRLRFLTRPPLSLGVYSLSSRTRAFNHERNNITVPVPHRQHRTVPVSREEALAVREKFRRVGWACTELYTQDEEDRCMGQESLGQVPDSWRPLSGVRVRVTDDVLSDIVSISVLILINTYYKVDPLTSKPGSTGCIVQPGKSHETISHNELQHYNQHYCRGVERGLGLMWLCPFALAMSFDSLSFSSSRFRQFHSFYSLPSHRTLASCLRIPQADPS
jgi:hypothetical protein